MSKQTARITHHSAAVSGVSSELPFHRGLRELGWIEGQTVTIEYRWAEGNYDRYQVLAAELVQAKVDVIVVGRAPAIGAAQRATSTIPIVFVQLTDPVASGLVKSLARPGANTTGLASQFEELICPPTPEPRARNERHRRPSLASLASRGGVRACSRRGGADGALPTTGLRRLLDLVQRL
jgi:hypothetical protein